VSKTSRSASECLSAIEWIKRAAAGFSSLRSSKHSRAPPLKTACVEKSFHNYF